MSSIRKRALSQAAVASFLALFVVLAIHTGPFEGNITGFFRIGDVLPLSPYLEDSTVRRVSGQVGYDGQLFLTIALDPSLKDERSIAALDNPRYRYRRILYPLLGHIGGLGKPGLIPYAMVGINVLCIPLLVVLASLSLSRGSGGDRKRFFLPLLALAVPGVWISLCLSTADVLAGTLFVAALVLSKGERSCASALAIACACLAKETYLAVAALLFLMRVAQRRKIEAIAYGAAAVPSLVWNALVLIRLRGGTGGVTENFGLPFSGIVEKLHLLATSGTGRVALVEAFSYSLLIGAVLLLLLSAPKNWRASPAVYLAALPYLLLVAVSKTQILGFYLDYLRVFTDLFFLNLLTADEPGFGGAKTVLLALSGAGVAAVAVRYLIL